MTLLLGDEVICNWLTVDLQLISISSLLDFLDKFFDLSTEYQEKILSQKVAEVLRDYSDRLEG